ncbi:MAG: FtsX-like permease family protein, partial [Acidobacteria bacterium]|nr:FtsX-like permease family protein [Acidobacteriota bacterium]
PVSGPHPLESYLHELVHPDRFAAFVMLSFALAGLSLAALGIFGLLSYVTTQRTREIGIRMAFGARRGQVLGMVVRHGLGLACMGIGLGVAAAWLVSRYLSTFVQDSQGVSWLAGIGALFALVTVALLATAIPAYHAARVDPLVALRHE